MGKRKGAPAAREDAPAPKQVAVTERLTLQELEKIRQAREDAARKKTIDTYNSQNNKFRHFLLHDNNGDVREQPLNGNLTDEGGQAVATRYLQWLQAGMPGKGMRGGTTKMTWYTFGSACSALQHLYEDQQSVLLDNNGGTRQILEWQTCHDVYDTTKKQLAGKGEREEGDPHAGTEEDTFKPDTWTLFTAMCWTLNLVRLLAMVLFMRATFGRSDDMRLIFISDIKEPRLLRNVGPAPCYLFSFLLRGGKTQLDGNKVTAGMVRHAVAQLCPVGAWGRYLVHRFTIKKHAFPDPKNEKEWHKAAMWPGLKWYQNITYEALRIDIVAVLKRCGIFIRKTCHAFRMFAAQEMELLGFPLDTIRRMGGWNKDAVVASYVKDLPVEGLLAAAEWPENGKQLFWAPRFMVEVPAELTDLLFPFLKQTKACVQELGATASVSMRTVPAALELVAVVIVQDALELVDKFPNEPTHQLLLGSEKFRMLHADYKRTLAVGGYNHLQPRTRDQQILEELLRVQRQQQQQVIFQHEQQEMFARQQMFFRQQQEQHQRELRLMSMLTQQQRREEAVVQHVPAPLHMQEVSQPSLMAWAAGPAAQEQQMLAVSRTPQQQQQQREEQQQQPVPARMPPHMQGASQPSVQLQRSVMAGPAGSAAQEQRMLAVSRTPLQLEHQREDAVAQQQQQQQQQQSSVPLHRQGALLRGIPLGVHEVARPANGGAHMQRLPAMSTVQHPQQQWTAAAQEQLLSPSPSQQQLQQREATAQQKQLQHQQHMQARMLPHVQGGVLSSLPLNTGEASWAATGTASQGPPTWQLLGLPLYSRLEGPASLAHSNSGRTPYDAPFRQFQPNIYANQAVAECYAPPRQAMLPPQIPSSGCDMQTIERIAKCAAAETLKLHGAKATTPAALGSKPVSSPQRSNDRTLPELRCHPTIKALWIWHNENKQHYKEIYENTKKQRRSEWKGFIQVVTNRCNAEGLGEQEVVDEMEQERLTNSSWGVSTYMKFVVRRAAKSRDQLPHTGSSGEPGDPAS